jgi:hypothetical protein
MDRSRHKFLFLFVKSCAILIIAFFLVYFLLDLSLMIYLARLKTEYAGYSALYSKCQPAVIKREASPESIIEMTDICDKMGFNVMNKKQKIDDSVIHHFFMMNHKYLERTLELPDDTITTPSIEHTEKLMSLKPSSVAIRDVFLKNEDPLWGVGSSQTVDLLKAGQIGEWLAVESLDNFRKGRTEESLLYSDALWRLSTSLLRSPYQQYWFTSASLALTYSGVLRKTGCGVSDTNDKLDISPFYWSVREIILKQTERLIEGTAQVGKMHYFNTYRRERILWRTYGRLWYRYSLIKGLRSRLDDCRDSETYLTCGAIKRRKIPAIDDTIWMLNGGEFRVEDLRYRLQKLHLSFELTKLVLCQKSGRKCSESGKGLLSCPQFRAMRLEDGNKIVIGYSMPFGNNARNGVIDIPTYYKIRK